MKKYNIIKCTGRNYYSNKDEKKFAICNKLIARGAVGSSSHRYAIANKDVTNTGEYTSTDIVGVSVNGARWDRLKFDPKEVILAIKAGATIVKDDPYNTNRGYNIGERELTEFLTRNHYVNVGSGIWKPSK